MDVMKLVTEAGARKQCSWTDALVNKAIVRGTASTGILVKTQELGKDLLLSLHSRVVLRCHPRRCRLVVCRTPRAEDNIQQERVSSLAVFYLRTSDNECPIVKEDEEEEEVVAVVVVEVEVELVERKEEN
ncbi:hypothetical protein O3P69_003145 [Scylla paramamosain]|uniref:Uncharacterized protein n=1 Tax=Scylla paramamosain TaxID=85552 RepID=A0AAW0UNM9_SCYPA